MSIYKELNTHPTRRDLLSFGLIFAGAMGLFGAYTYLGSHHDLAAATRLWIFGGAVLVLAQLPVIGRWLYILWMAFGLTLGFFTAPLMMFVIYALVMVPVALVFKLTKRDLMRRSLDPKAGSYWEPYPRSDDPASYYRQF
jgi:hypothetical protein